MFDKTWGKIICGGFPRINAHAEQERSELSRTGDCSGIQNPHNGYYSQRRSATWRGSNSVLPRPWPIRDGTNPRGHACSLVAGKLCEEHGYSHEWTSGQKPHFAENGRKYYATRKTMHRSLSQDYGQVPPVRVQGRLLHRYHRTRLMILRQVQQQYDVEVQAFRYWETSCEILQKPETKTNKDTVPVHGNLLRDLPEWLEEFKENPEDIGVLASRDTRASTSRESASEPPRKVVSGKHSIFTQFPKDQNCEVCKRTKITRAPCRRWTGNSVLSAEKFGDLITADHKVLSGGCESLNTHRCAVVVQDFTTRRIQPCLCKSKTSQETERGSPKFLEPSESRKSFTLTIYWSLARWIMIIHQRFVDPRRVVLLRE